MMKNIITHMIKKKKIFHVFKYDKEIQGYIPIQEHESVYADIIRKLLKLS